MDATNAATPATVSRVARWERATEAPLIVLSLAFLIAYAWPVLDPELPRGTQVLLRTVNQVVWGVFALDFLLRVLLARRRLRYIGRHWYDVAMIAIPIFRPLRLLRVFRLLSSVGLVNRTSIYVASTALVCIFLGALAVLDAEQSAPGANITEFGDALWWAIVTSATVGYGDFYPVTGAGRAIAVVLMLSGIALLGSITAGVASWAVTSVEHQDTDAD
ncbi:potassium channel family protein [Zhihengliuella flava]|uniref:Voltage-gated potassium channel n=1 Tax=Zhihengliuella flava TaxID=1285193 RepID=A0A931GIQ4_9MICC|nr:potassium channel family protein [Zhihengliuella flava]MBG6084516.1 voltage-gated potassium channel [Zhihengliuella flava]